MSDETARGAPTRHPGPDKGIPEEGVQPRRKWANNREFLLSMVGGVIGLTHFWHLAQICFRNGGGEGPGLDIWKIFVGGYIE